ncbi:DUF1573 domain-containing protein [Bacteroides cellulosilyticus]|jgi:hypothetical protein|uniref:DUF1573 domain-containing protein n=1 Tax=Bacteroides cellulosilyticus TaxID=246787 RepID=UPI00189819FD|nr:DUF1573 domain-containing protein [Bacteroides cellulosilyticus]
MPKNIYVLVLVFFLLISCKESKKESISHLVTEWMGKEIAYPDDIAFTLWGKDTIMNRTSYTIVTYADSIGCINCKLQLKKWLAFITELRDKVGDKVKMHFILFPKDPKEMVALLRQDKFDYPVCIDVNDSFNKLNHLSSIMMFQTFLLNEDNEVIAIGNPIYNPKVKELYVGIINGEVDVQKEHIILQTEITVSNNSTSLGVFSWEDEQTTNFTLKNIGKNPLVIENVSTSCGCTSVSYSKEPVRSGNSVILNVSYKADHPEHFNKTITVYCNAESSPILLRIAGDAE